MLEIRYTASSLSAPERVRFKYRLRGFDAAWRDAARQREALYRDLQPGDYSFEVLAANPHGVWSEAPASFAFSLAPHFWQTWPFFAGSAGCVLALGGLIEGYRLRWQRRLLKLEEQRALAGQRARIARDLHDDLGANLTGIALQLEAAERLGRADQAHLADLAEEARSVAHAVRELAWATNPRCDDSASVASFVGEWVEQFCRRAGLECRLELPEGGPARAIAARVRHELMAVVKESLTNVAKHARARQVTVGLVMEDNRLRLSIHDDGRGFDPARAAAGTGLGNLRERVHQLRGSFAVQSRPGGGASIVVRLPLDPTS